MKFYGQQLVCNILAVDRKGKGYSVHSYFSLAGWVLHHGFQKVLGHRSNVLV